MDLAALGAFLSGAGSVLGAIVAIRAMRRRMQKECEERLQLYKDGIAMGERHERLARPEERP
jgi:hypothetical protein